MPSTNLELAEPDALRSALAKFGPGTSSTASVRERQAALFTQAESSGLRTTNERQVPMTVLNLSMPRTGTMSMQAALQRLGHRCYHGSLLFSRMGDCARWNAALDAKFFHRGRPFTRADWDGLLGEFSAVSADLPAVAFAPELVAAYPEAKVILVERDLEAWFRSFSTTVTSGMWSPLMHRIADWDPWLVGPLRDTFMRCAHGWFQATSRAQMDAVSRDVYARHYACVRRLVPRDRLLEYRLGDGWAPLCAFLRLEVPEGDFPRVNDSDAVWEQMVIMAQRGMRNGAWRLAQLGTITLGILGIALAMVGWMQQRGQ